MLFPNLSMSGRKKSPTPPLPVAPVYSVPSDNPSLQSGMDPFSASFSGITPDVSAPVLSGVTKNGKANRCVWVSGHQFANDLALMVYGESSAGIISYTSCVRLFRSGNKALFVLPASIPSRAFIIAYPVTSAGTGYPLSINAPEIFTVNCDSWGGPTCEVDATCYLGGINLTNDDNPAKSWVYLQPGSGIGQYVPVFATAEGLVAFTVPSVPLGTYQIWIHNGRGGRFGWHRSRIDLVITTAASFGRDYTAMSVNLSTYTAIHGGGPGSGVSMVTAWNAALDALSGVGGTINLEAGNYVTDGMLGFIVGGANVAFVAQGAGKDVTFIRPMSGYTNAENYGLFQANSVVNEIRDMTLDFDNGLGTVTTTITRGFGMRRVKIKSASRDCAVSFNNNPSDTIVMDDCDLWGGLNSSGSVALSSMNNALIRNCRMRVANLTESAFIFQFETINVCVIVTATEDYAPGSNTGRGRFFTTGTQTNGVTVYDCTTNGLQVGGSDQNKGEQILLADGGDVSDSMFSTGGTATTVKVSTADVGADRTGLLLIVAGGKGVSQYARITSVSTSGGDTVYTLDRPFLVTTDATSLILFCLGALDVSVSDCDLSGDGTNTGASMAFQAFSPGANLHFCNNNATDLNFAYSVWAPQIWFEFRDNTFTNCNNAIRVFSFNPPAVGQDVDVGLTVHRDISVSGTNVKDMQIASTAASVTVLDHFTIPGNASIGLFEGGGGGDLVMYESSIGLGSGTFSGSKAIDVSDATPPITVTQSPDGQFHGFES